MLDVFTSLVGNTFTTYTRDDLQELHGSYTPDVTICIAALSSLLSDDGTPLDHSRIAELVQVFVIHLTELGKFSSEMLTGPSMKNKIIREEDIVYFLQAHATLLPCFSTLNSMANAILSPFKCSSPVSYIT